MRERDSLRLVITGGRTYNDTMFVDKVMRIYQRIAKEEYKTLVVVQGGAQGADTAVRNWCKANGVPCFTCDAHWTYYGDPAGTIRNQWMIEFFKPTHGFVFPGDKGTKDAHQKMIGAGLIVQTYEDL